MTSLAGAVMLKEVNRTVLFKNRDLERTEYKEEIFYDNDLFGIRGLNRNSGETEGLGIGVNRNGLVVANTHVLATVDPSYDIMTEQILMFAKDAEDGLTMTVDHLSQGNKVQWGNLILADHDSMLVIEIAGSNHSMEWSNRKVLRTGHHVMLDTEEEIQKNSAKYGSYTQYEDSVKRFNRGYELLRDIIDLDGVFALLRDHGDVMGQHSICKHSTSTQEMGTAASYIIEVDHEDSDKPKIALHTCRGNPCENEYTTIPIVFPADEEAMKGVHESFFK